MNSNLVTETGDSFIPASQRPDGTWRKARRVKDGYVPQEEVPLYESKGKQHTQRVTKPEPVQLSNGDTAHRPIPGLFIIESKQKKPSTKKSKKPVEDLTHQLSNATISEKPDAGDPIKKLKNLKKRLREVEALEEKLKSGLVAKPEPEQLAKIQRKADLVLQIHQLEKQIG